MNSALPIYNALRLAALGVDSDISQTGDFTLLCMLPWCQNWSLRQVSECSESCISIGRPVAAPCDRRTTRTRNLATFTSLLCDSHSKWIRCMWMWKYLHLSWLSYNGDSTNSWVHVEFEFEIGRIMRIHWMWCSYLLILDFLLSPVFTDLFCSIGWPYGTKNEWWCPVSLDAWN
jgi:hypothetical protein